MDILRATRCEINIAALERNADRARTLFGREITLMAVLKANAYGHGAVAMMRHLVNAGIQWFAVAAINEALELRRRFPEPNLLILGHTPNELLPRVVKNDIIQTIYSYEQAALLDEIAREQNKTARAFIKVETGLGRIGFAPVEKSINAIQRIKSLKNLNALSVFSATSGTDDAHERMQLKVFHAFLDGLEAKGLKFEFTHIANGNTVGRCPWMLEETRFNMVRPGCMFFGNSFFPGFEEIIEMKSRVIRVMDIPAGQGVGYKQNYVPSRPKRIATLPYGHADGVPVALGGGNGYVLIRGRQAPYEGKLCMDMCMVDVSEIPGVQEGDDVVVFGHTGGAMTWAEAGERSGLTGNAVKAMLQRRVPRVYHRDGALQYVVDDTEPQLI